MKDVDAKVFEEGQNSGLQKSPGQKLNMCLDASEHAQASSPFPRQGPIDSYFVHFEHTATMVDWPPDKLPILLSTVL